MSYSGVSWLLAGEPVGYEKVTVAGTAVGLTIPSDATKALMVLEDAKVRFRDDGTNPTATEGMPLNIDQSLVIESGLSLGKFKAIRTGATSGTLYILYYKR